MALVDHISVRRVSAGARPVTEGAQAVLLKRAAALGEKDRLVLDLAFRRKLSVREIGIILDRPAGTVCRTVQRLCARLRDPIVAALLDERCALAPEYRQLGVEHFAGGKTIRELADLHQVPMQQARQMIQFVRQWYGGIYRNEKREPE